MKTVTKPKPPPDQLEDLLGRLLVNRTASVPVPAPVEEVPTGEKLLQCLMAEIQSRQPAAVTKLCTGLERLVWTVHGGAATPLEPQPLGNEATGWLVSDDGRPKLLGYRHPQTKQTVMCRPVWWQCECPLMANRAPRCPLKALCVNGSTHSFQQGSRGRHRRLARRHR